MADAHERPRDAERRMTTIDDELAAMRGELVSEVNIAAAPANIADLWERLAPPSLRRSTSGAISGFVWTRRPAR